MKSAAILPFEPDDAPAPAASDGPRLQRGQGTAELALKLQGGDTALAHLYQRDPCRILFPRAEPGEPFGAVLLATSGGLAGGDRLRLAVAAGAGTRAVVTSQAAEKIYRSTGADAVVETALRVEPGAWLEWLPQETILFEGARLSRALDIDVAPGGALLAGEIAAFGRAARGEAFTRGLWFERWRVRRGGRLAWLDRTRLDNDAASVLAAPAGFAGAGAVATVIAVTDTPQAWLDTARAALEGARSSAGVTIVNGVLVARFLAPGTGDARRDVARYWSALRHAMAGLPPAVPRIWHF